jgi:hypothetical protein
MPLSSASDKSDPPGTMLCPLSSKMGLFSWYASNKYLLLESWEEE